MRYMLSLSEKSERLELMLGDGLLSWQTREGQSVHHPLLLLRLQLNFNPQTPEFTLVETDHPPELYTALFQAISEVDAINLNWT